MILNHRFSDLIPFIILIFLNLLLHYIFHIIDNYQI